MKTTIFNRLLIVLMFFGLTTFVACNKLQDATEETVESADDNSAAETHFDEVFTSANSEAQQTDLVRGGSCPTVTVTPLDSVTYPKTVTIDYGTNCIAPDGRTKSGVITITYSGRWRVEGTVINISLSNYFVDGRHIEGSKTITVSRLANGHLNYNNVVTGGHITNVDGTSHTWQSNKNYEWIEGEGTTFHNQGIAGVLDDVYLITGSASGVNRHGRSYTCNITEPLRRELDCRWLVSGKVEITPAGKAARTIDFGNGTCDNQATVSVGSITRTITLH